MDHRSERSDEAQPFIELALHGEELFVDTKRIALLANCGPDPKWQNAVREAADRALSLAQPRARWVSVPDEIVGDLFPNQTAVEEIANAGPRWAFIATIGNALETQSKALLADGHYLEGVLLDAAGSVTADTFCDRVEATCAGGENSARFSPGYCSWSLEAQRTLFSILRPEELGISLRPSMLMEPLKSVSGIVVCAPKKALRVAPEVCRDCDAKGCTRRPMK